MCTSLQNIVLNHHDQLLAEGIKDLFRGKQYPLFALQEFHHHALYAQHQQFRFFIDILEEWNRKVEKKEIHSHSETLFRKNIFIYNSLRNAILHQRCNADHILGQLYGWFNQTRCHAARPLAQKPPQQRCDDEWQIRNAFKSNLPAEIGMYNRRMFWNYEDNNKGKTFTTQPLKNKKIHTEPSQNEEYRPLHDKRLFTIQNQLIRSNREKNEFLSIERKWHVKRSREGEENTKNCYGGFFTANKTYFKAKKKRVWTKDTEPVILKRVNTSLGFRTKATVNRYSTENDEKSHPVRQHTSLFEQFDNNVDGIKSVDGLRLMTNPFEKKLKKKKKRN